MQIIALNSTKWHNMVMLQIIALVLIAGFSGIYFLQDKLIFYPQKLSKDHQFHFPAKFKESWWEVDKGVKIHGLHFFPKQESNEVILYFHGNAGSLDSWGNVGVELSRLGYHVIVIDYRGYGKSGGSVAPKSLLSDALKIYDIVAKTFAPENVIIYGRSIGTPMATHLASQRKCSKVVLETPFDTLSSLLSVHYPIVPKFFLRYHFNNIDRIKDIKAPILIVHGTADQIIPYEIGKTVAEKLTEKDSFITVENGGHNNLSNFEAYWQGLKGFLLKD
jgi:uncharacterized protein